MTEQEIREMVETDCSFTLVPEGLLLSACEIPNFVKALHQKFKQALLAELELALGKESLNMYHNGGILTKLEWLEHRIGELKGER